MHVETIRSVVVRLPNIGGKKWFREVGAEILLWYRDPPHGGVRGAVILNVQRAADFSVLRQSGGLVTPDTLEREIVEPYVMSSARQTSMDTDLDTGRGTIPVNGTPVPTVTWEGMIAEWATPGMAGRIRTFGGENIEVQQGGQPAVAPEGYVAFMRTLGFAAVVGPYLLVIAAQNVSVAVDTYSVTEKSLLVFPEPSELSEATSGLSEDVTNWLSGITISF